VYNVKKQIYQGFSKTQKAALCNFLRALVKKSPETTAEKFIEDERYYFAQGQPRFEFVNLDDERFLKETTLYMNECRKFYEYQKPFVQAQKERRRVLRDEKMKREPPTQKQVKFYKSLCERYNLDIMDEGQMSKYSVREAIAEVLNEHTGNCEDTD
jgi:hypothetical protein